MDRRLFLKSASAAGALAWILPGTLAAQSSTVSDTYLAAVPFVIDPVLGGLSQADRDVLFQVSSSATAVQQAAIYPQSVASGDPRTTGVVLWTRVDPTQQGSPSNDMLAWQIGTDSSFAPATILIEGVAVIAGDRDGTVKIPVANSLLNPFTQYYYRFIYNQVTSRTGRFKTLPLQTDSLSLLKLGYVVCQDYGNGYYNALTYLAEEQVDFVVHLGDYIYETIDSGSFQNTAVRTVPPFPSGGQIPQNVPLATFTIPIDRVKLVRS
jgi:phosphodiesterase/alkaline phosphatase D-like protein